MVWEDSLEPGGMYRQHLFSVWPYRARKDNPRAGVTGTSRLYHGCIAPYRNDTIRAGFPRTGILPVSCHFKSYFVLNIVLCVEFLILFRLKCLEPFFAVVTN